MNIKFLSLFIPGFRFFWNCSFMGIGGSSKSNQSTTSSSDNSTKVTTTNEQVGATQGSIGVGAGATANVTIANDDPKTLQHIADINADVSKAAIATSAQSSKDALNFATGSLNTVGSTVQEANDILSHSFESYASKLKDNTGVAPSTVAISGNNNTTILVTAAIAIIGWLIYSRKAN